MCNDFGNHVFNNAGMKGYKSNANTIKLAKAVRSLFVFYCFPVTKIKKN